MDVHRLYAIAFHVMQDNLHVVEIWNIAAPSVDLGHSDPCGRGLALHCDSAHFAAFGIGEDNCRHEIVAQLQVDVERSILIVVFKPGGQTYILDMFEGTGIEIAVACQTRKAEEILVLEIGAIAPAHHLEGDEVLLSRLHEACQIKLTSQFTVFAISYETSIDIKGDIRSHRTEMSDDLLPLPRCWNEELSTIASHTILFGGRNGRIVGVVSAPCIAEIQIQRISITIEFPQSGHGHFVPCTIVEANFEEVTWRLAGSMDVVEAPQPMQREVLLLQGCEVGMHRQSVNGIDLRVLPCIAWSLGKKSGGEQGKRQNKKLVFHKGNGLLII